MRRPCIEGPNIFPSRPDDERPVNLFAVNGKIFVARFPAITSRPWSDKPIVSETIFMENKQVPQRPFAKDIYGTLPLESDQ